MQKKLQWGGKKKKGLMTERWWGGGGPRRRDSECVQGHSGAGASIHYLDSVDGFTAVLCMLLHVHYIYGVDCVSVTP